MTNKKLKQPLSLYSPQKTAFILEAVELDITRSDKHITACRLQGEVTFEQHILIETESLFNLVPEMRLEEMDGEFEPDRPIHITLTLNPAYFEMLGKQEQVNKVIEYLQQLGQQNSDHQLLSTNNWLLLQVKQTQEEKTVEYKTIWHTLRIDQWLDFFSKTGQFATDLLSELSELIPTDTNLSDTDWAEILANMAAVDSESPTSAPKSTPTTQPPESLWQAVQAYFKAAEWGYHRIPDRHSLQTIFEGKNGTLTCLAHVRETQNQLIFYAVCPLKVPPDKRPTMANYLTRTNYGLAIGNFELDVSDGEIRYKTSLDLSGCQIETRLIQNVIQANVLTLDQYLPEIMTIIYSVE
ncbi:YbjN domain-containing protein [Anaerolineales bacterium HSG24]|nr:YbjN domain-containing protein [Anaerolineales bacterium HSG24]